MGDPEIYNCREWQQESFMPTGWKEDILRRAEANMQRRHEGDERDAVRRMIDRDIQYEEAREALAWRITIGIIIDGCLIALALRHFGVSR